jgi:RNA polymerase sigma-70 factor, ECF subfamily
MTELYLPLVHGWCLRGGVPRSDVADLVQEVFSAVAQSLDRFRHDHDGASFRGWLHGITRHKVLDYWRKRPLEGRAAGGTDAHQYLANVEDPLGDEGGSEQLSDAALLMQRALERISAEFEPHTRLAFEKTALEDGRPHDVAEQLGMTIAAVYKAKSRVLKRLRETLGDLDH